MAKINGVEIKKYRSFYGHEGENVAEAIVYIDGKRAGVWSQDSWGGPDRYDGFEDKVSEKAALVQAGFPKDDWDFHLQNEPDVFMQNLLLLAEDEKNYKKMRRQGFRSLITMSDGYHYSYIAYRKVLEKENFWDECMIDLVGLKQEMFKNKRLRIGAYNCPEDFAVVVDQDHPAPYWMTRKKWGPIDTKSYTV